jgi:hypothetical protein
VKATLAVNDGDAQPLSVSHLPHRPIFQRVIAGLDPAIHEAVHGFRLKVCCAGFIMDARVKPAHDVERLRD